MDTIRRLCEGQNRQTRRRILAAYYRGAIDALEVPRGDLAVNVEQWADGDLLKMWYETQQVPGEGKTTASSVLLGLPREAYERTQATALAIERGTAMESERTLIRQHISPARQADPGAMSDVWGFGGPDAPRGLQQAAGGDVAVQDASHGAAQVGRYVPVMLRRQAD